ncbi:MAG: hemoglobin [Herpetosiphonaceae bacterium]|nr:MAG: hemoglobin [Herpetosiphonaceae bacterium]
MSKEMNKRQIELVQESFKQVAPIAETAAALFYQRLFELDPSVRPYFKTDMKTQGAKPMSTLALVVQGLNRPEEIIPAVQHLGRRHAGYGVKHHHYQVVAEALLWALAQGLGDAFTPAVKEAWTAAYRFLAEIMQEAMATAGVSV